MTQYFCLCNLFIRHGVTTARFVQQMSRLGRNVEGENRDFIKFVSSGCFCPGPSRLTVAVLRSQTARHVMP